MAAHTMQAFDADILELRTLVGKLVVDNLQISEPTVYRVGCLCLQNIDGAAVKAVRRLTSTGACAPLD